MPSIVRFFFSLAMMFYWIFANYSCTYMDKQLFATSDKICLCPHQRIYGCLQIFPFKFCWTLFLNCFCSQHIWILSKHLQHSHAQDRTYNFCIYLFEVLCVGLDRELTINLTLSINLILYVPVLQFSIFSLYWYWEFYVSFCILP